MQPTATALQSGTNMADGVLVVSTRYSKARLSAISSDKTAVHLRRELGQRQRACIALPFRDVLLPNRGIGNELQHHREPRAACVPLLGDALPHVSRLLRSGVAAAHCKLRELCERKAVPVASCESHESRRAPSFD